MGNGLCLCLSEGGHGSQGEGGRGGREIVSVSVSVSEIEGSLEAWWIPWFMVVFYVVVAAKTMSGHINLEVRGQK